ncbi:MAG: penicillin-binding transpeptidase domain-containing protein [Eubacteriales bacterium]|nr:penicillin-binding transpeptidase domain-containing protein [Eubacteriales bacterium]
MQKKLAALFIMVLLAFVGLGAQILRINRDNGQAYTMQVLSQQAYDNQTIPYKRGKIMDRKGTVLADSQLVYNVIVDAKQILEKDAYLEPSLDALESLGINRTDIKSYITGHPSSQYYIARKNLTYQERKDYLDGVEQGMAQEVKEHIPASKRKYHNIKGIWFESNYIRTYPHGNLGCTVLGYSGANNAGNGGIEEYYNSTLNGVEGRQYGYLDDSLNMERTTINARDGNNLILTLDSNIQSIVQKHLDSFNEEYRDNEHYGNGANNVACIVMDVNTGGILAMAGTPFYDPNSPSDLTALRGMPKLDSRDEAKNSYLSTADLLTMTEEDKPRYLNALWSNFCVSEYYEPGSTIKPFTVATGLETGTVSTEDTFECEGYLNIDDFRIRCHNVFGDGLLTVGEAVERSCNVALMMMAQQEGKENFTKFQNIFNFGLRTGVDIADEARTDGFVHDSTMTDATLATNAFGQNFDVTMIQMITGFCSLINGGNYYQPYIVDRITSPNGVTVSTTEPRVLKKTVSEDTSSLIRQYTLQVVEGENGTGKTARPAGYRIGGKTGTAETLPRENHEYVVSFMGYAPYEDPQIAIYVVVDRPNVEMQDDAKYATTIVRDILTEVLPYLNIYMTEPVSDEEREELEELGLAVTYNKADEDKEDGDSAEEDAGEDPEDSSGEDAGGDAQEGSGEDAGENAQDNGD